MREILCDRNVLDHDVVVIKWLQTFLKFIKLYTDSWLRMHENHTSMKRKKNK